MTEVFLLSLTHNVSLSLFLQNPQEIFHTTKRAKDTSTLDFVPVLLQQHYTFKDLKNMYLIFIRQLKLKLSSHQRRLIKERLEGKACPKKDEVFALIKLQRKPIHHTSTYTNFILYIPQNSYLEQVNSFPNTTFPPGAGSINLSPKYRLNRYNYIQASFKGNRHWSDCANACAIIPSQSVEMLRLWDLSEAKQRDIRNPK